jgi:hypothetical protein
MPAVTPAERHNPARYGSPGAITPAERHNPERYASPSAIQPARLRAPLQPAAAPSGASRQACHAGGHAGRATQSRTLRESQSPSGPHDCALHLNPPPPQVEQAARLAMPAVTPAEEHNPDLYGGINAIQPARLRAPLQPAAARWSKPPGLPCRRSRRQSDTILNATGVQSPSGPHACALHLNPPPLSPSPCPPCSLWFAFSVPSVSCPMWGRLSSLRPAFQPALAPLPTALCPTQCHAVLYLFIMMNKITTRTGRP